MESSGPRSSDGDYMYEVRKERKYRRLIPGLVSPRDCRLAVPQEARDRAVARDEGLSCGSPEAQGPFVQCSGASHGQGPQDWFMVAI